MRINNSDQGNKSDKQDKASQNRYKSFKGLLCIISIYCLGMFYFGYCLVYLGAFRFHQIVTIFTIQMNQNIALGLLQGCVPIGAGIGALLSYPLLKFVSRRKILLVVNILSIIVNILIFQTNFRSLFLCRLSQGICSGSYTTVIPIMIKQLVPYQISGSFGAFNQMFKVVGITFAFILQYLILVGIQNHGGDILQLWRIQFGFPIIILVFQTIIIIFVYDFQTPKYLLSQGREQQCRILVSKIYKQSFIQQVMTQKKIDLGLLPFGTQEVYQSNPQLTNSHKQLKSHGQYNKKYNQQNIQDQEVDYKIQLRINKQQIDVLNDLIQHKVNKKPPIQQLKIQKKQPRQNQNKIVHKTYLRRFVSIDLSILQPFTGTNAIGSYGVLIVYEVFPQYANIIPILLNLGTLIIIMVTSGLLSKFGRKSLLQLGTMIISISLLVVSIGYFLDMESNPAKVMIITGLFSWTVGFGLLGPIARLYVPQVVQPQFNPFPRTISWFMSGFVLVMFPILLQSFGTAAPIFAFFAGYNLLFFVINQKIILQTKNKTETQIYNQYDQLL